MRTSNRLSREYWEAVEHEAVLRYLKNVERTRDMLLEGGRMYGEIEITPEIAAQLAAMPPEPPPAPTAAAVPQTGVM